MMRGAWTIPVFEPEVIAGGARRHFGDPEKVATTALKSITLHGIIIESRYRKVREYELMLAMVRDLSRMQRAWMHSIFCDSKASNTYTVTLRKWNARIAEIIANEISYSAKLRVGGHNGISVLANNDSEHCLNFDPVWNEQIERRA